MNENNLLDGVEFMGENVKDKVKFCGEGVVIYPLAKIIRPTNAELDNYCRIFDFSFIDGGTSVKIGKYTTITWYVLIEGGGTVSIGDRVFVGPGSKILNSTYKLNGYYVVEHMAEGVQEIDYKDIVIEDDAYIGANCTIMPGIHIGKGAVIGANSLVTKDVEPWGIYVGTPAKKIGVREKPTEERQKIVQSLDWSNHL